MSANKKRSVWVLAQLDDDGEDWSLGGVFTSRKRAREACTHWTDQIWKEVLNTGHPREPMNAEYLELPLWGAHGLKYVKSKYYDMGTGEEVTKE